jgi:hypothetical protein
MSPSPRLPMSISLFLLLLASASSARAQSNRLLEISKQLRSIETSQGNGYLPSTDVPPLAQKLLPQMKSELRTLFWRTLNEHAAVSPDSLRAFLLADLKSAGLEVFAERQFENNYNPDAAEFGKINDVRIRQPAKHPDLLVIDVSLSVPCGDDHSLTVFQRADGPWEPLLIADANGYEEVSGAQGSLEYAISPADGAGNWFLVTAGITPWCSSNWQGLHYRVLRPGASPETPRVLLKEERGVHIGVDEPFRLKITSRGFEIHNVGSQGLDSSLLTRVHVQKYQVTGDKVTRVPPFALLPEDFLDEWFSLKWEDAAQWTSDQAKSELEHWHERFDERQKVRDFYTEFDFVQPCPDTGADARWQIGLTLEGSSEKDLPEDLPEELFFTVVKRDGAFYLDGVAERRPGRCPGESRPRGYDLNSRLP